MKGAERAVALGASEIAVAGDGEGGNVTARNRTNGFMAESLVQGRAGGEHGNKETW